MKEPIKLVFNLELLITLIKENTVLVYYLHNKAFGEYAIKAKKLFDVIHTVSDCGKDIFVDYVSCLSKNDLASKTKYERIEAVDVLFTNVEFEGRFKIIGYEELNGDPFIRYKNIEHKIKLN